MFGVGVVVFPEDDGAVAVGDAGAVEAFEVAVADFVDGEQVGGEGEEAGGAFGFGDVECGVDLGDRFADAEDDGAGDVEAAAGLDELGV